MDFAEIMVTAGGVALILFTLWFFFGKGQEKEGRGKKGLYACPMHPWITSDDPAADCSICGMKLVRSNEVA